MVWIHLYDLATQVISIFLKMIFSLVVLVAQFSYQTFLIRASYLRLVVRKPACMVWLHHFHFLGHFNPHAKKQGNATLTYTHATYS